MRRLVAGAACLFAFMAPAEAGNRYATPAYSFEVPGGWRATTGPQAGEVVLYAPGSKTEFIAITARASGARSLAAAPTWAKRGATSLAGASARTAVWDQPVKRDVSTTTVVVQASRGGRAYVISAVYRRPDGDLVVDRHWNVAMALVVRTWRWAK